MCLRQCLRGRLYPVATLIVLLTYVTSQPYLAVDAAHAATSAEVPDWHGQVLQLTDRPRAYQLKGFLTDAECDYLIENARAHLINSTVIDNKTHKSIPSNVRTSAGMFFALGGNEVARAIEARIAKVTHIPATHGEGLQVLRYVNGQEYKPHHDFFSEGFPDTGSGQRLATVLMYLTTPEEGGETVFPLGRPLSQGSEWSPCAREGLSLKAVRGDAVLFWALKLDGSVDRHSLHGSCPTLKGEKWSATKWIHIRPYQF